MRRFIVAVCAAVVVTGGLAACGSSTSNGSSSPKAGGSASAVSCTKSGLSSQLHTAGKLTVATDNPVYPPWFVQQHPDERQGL